MSMGVQRMKNNQTKLSQRVRYALLAGMAGAFLIPQVGFAAPMGEHDVTSGVTVGRVGSTTNIGGTAANNLIKWNSPWQTERPLLMMQKTI